ncbi:MAG: glycosyltransferase family 87 protein [Chloroflexota bacterium]
MNKNQIFFSTIALVILFVMMIVGTYFSFTVRVPGANDLYPRWRGAQLYWLEGVDPYSVEATEAIQRDMYGRLAEPDEDQVLFVYPFYVVFPLLPLVGLPYAWVQAVWLVVLMFSLVAGVLMGVQFLEWKMPLWLTAVTLLWAIIYYSSTRTIILGQFAGVVFVCLIGCLLMLKHERDLTAGALLALSTFKPQMVFLVIPALLIWGFGQKRWRFLGSFIGWMAGLAGLSFLLEPRWLVSFVEQVFAYPGYTVIGNPIQILTTYYLPLGDRAGAGVDIIARLGLLLWMGWLWRDLGKTAVQSKQFLYIMSITFLVTNLVVPETATTNYVMLYLPLLWGLKYISERWQWGNFSVTLFYGVSFILIWALFILLIDGDSESPMMFLPLPFGLLAMLTLARQKLLHESLKVA